MRALAFLSWLAFTFIALFALLTLALSRVLSEPYTAEQLGYAAGRWLFLVAPASLLIVVVGFAGGWLPGSRKKVRDVSEPRA
jgi:hypothetical protein